MEYCYIVRCRIIQNTLLVIKLLIKIHNYEYVMEDLKRIKRNNWVAKHPDTVQNIYAAFGWILSKMTGGSGHTGAYISRMGTKWNELDEEMAAMRGWNLRDEFNKWIEDSVSDYEGIKDEKCMEINWA